MLYPTQFCHVGIILLLLHPENGTTVWWANQSSYRSSRRSSIGLLGTVLHFQTEESRISMNLVSSCLSTPVHRRKGQSLSLCWDHQPSGPEAGSPSLGFSARRVTLPSQGISPEGGCGKRRSYGVSGTLASDCGVRVLALTWLFADVMTWNSLLSPRCRSASFMENHRRNWVFVLWCDKWSDMN